MFVSSIDVDLHFPEELKAQDKIHQTFIDIIVKANFT